MNTFREHLRRAFWFCAVFAVYMFALSFFTSLFHWMLVGILQHEVAMGPVAVAALYATVRFLHPPFIYARYYRCAKDMIDD